jgi:hypothetical protein
MWQCLYFRDGQFLLPNGTPSPIEPGTVLSVEGEALTNDDDVRRVADVFASLEDDGAIPIPKLTIWALTNDAQRELATSLLRRLTRLRALELSCSYDDAGLPALDAVPPSVSDLKLSVLNGPQLDLAALAPSPSRRWLKLAATNGSIDLSALHGDHVVASFELRGKARSPEVISSWPALSSLGLHGAIPLERCLLPALQGPLTSLTVSTTATAPLDALAHAPALRELHLGGLKNDDADLIAVAALKDLAMLHLGAMKGVRSLAVLAASAPRLSTLSLSNLKFLATLEGLEALPGLRALRFAGDFSSALDISALERCAALYEMEVKYLKKVGVARALMRFAMARGLALTTEEGLV